MPTRSKGPAQRDLPSSFPPMGGFAEARYESIEGIQFNSATSKTCNCTPISDTQTFDRVAEGGGLSLTRLSVSDVLWSVIDVERVRRKGCVSLSGLLSRCLAAGDRAGKGSCSTSDASSTRSLPMALTASVAHVFVSLSIRARTTAASKEDSAHLSGGRGSGQPTSTRSEVVADDRRRS